MIRSAVRAGTRCALAITTLHPRFNLRNLAYEEGKKRGSLQPVYNSRVAKTIADFGYKAPHGVGADGRYIAFRNTMKRFMDACKRRGLSHVDAISLDAFFYDRSRELGY